MISTTAHLTVLQWIDAHRDCPLSFLLTHVDAELRREPELLGKVFWQTVLELL